MDSVVKLEPRNPIGNLKRLVFPYTPQIDYTADVKYDTYNTTHTNYQLYGYTRSENPQINLQCKFSSHTFEHAQLSLTAIRFLRTYSKMNYGRQDPARGVPPRILRFYAYGAPIFYDVPVVINKFNITFPDDVDYTYGILDAESRLAKMTSSAKETDSSPEDIYLPSVFQISISLLVQQNLYKAVTEFKLEDLASGKLSGDGYI